MSTQLAISVGQHSSKGRKDVNQDFHGICIPKQPLLSSKGIAIALADGIGSSSISQFASETVIKSFLDDYYCTSESWSVKASAERVIHASNSWLYAQNQRSQHRHNKDKGYACTFSSIVIKSSTAYIFHVGDSRIYHLNNNLIETVTEEHRSYISENNHYLSRAIGVSPNLDIDHRSIRLNVGALLITLTDGIYEHVNDDLLIKIITEYSHDLEQAARKVVDAAYNNGSEDNLTVQIIRIDQLPEREASVIHDQLTALPFPPTLQPRMKFDGYEIIRDVYISSRSHVVLARDCETNTQVIIKTPSIELRSDSAYLERFLTEEWIAKRLNSAHVLKPAQHTRERQYFYIVTEYIDGQTLAQWIIDNPKPSLETVRNIVEQIAKGLRSFHRQEMLHQDLRPNNIMIDKSGTVKIIDFGSTRVAGLDEMDRPTEQGQILGTMQYSAPEYFVGEYGTRRSDLYSLAVITYQMLSGRFPYGTEVSKARTKAAQRQLKYRSVLDDKREIPAWLDDTLKKALHPNPYKRYTELSEFIFDLRHPNRNFLNKNRLPLIERNPLLFWKCLSFLLALIIIIMTANQI